MTKLDYRSPLWRKRKRNYYKKYNRECAACGMTHPVERIHLHHMDYDYPFGEEPDRVLVPLCKRHHMEVHRYASSVAEQYDLEEATKIYIRLFRAGKPPLRTALKKSKKKNYGSKPRGKRSYTKRKRTRRPSKRTSAYPVKSSSKKTKRKHPKNFSGGAKYKAPHS